MRTWEHDSVNEFTQYLAAKPLITNSGPIEKVASLAVFVLFSLSTVLAVILVELSVPGLPVRSLLVLGALGIAVTVGHRWVKPMVEQRAYMLLIICLFALLGVAVSVMNGTPTAIIARQILEIHVQAAIGLLLATWIVITMGVRAVVVAFLAAWALTSIFAIGQALHLDAAWQMRQVLGDIMGDPPLTRKFYDMRERPTGLSYSPVHIATQTCLAFVAVYALRVCQKGREIFEKVDWAIILMLMLSILVCMASGNRSPLIGFAIFGIIYPAMVKPKIAALLLPVGIVAAIGLYSLMDVLDASGMRVASTDDGSAAGRMTLAYFGMRLLEFQPLGYGLSFESTDLWAAYSHEVIYMENPNVIRNFALHNYYLMMLCKYGITIIFLLPLIFPRNRYHWLMWMAFIPYIIHIYFHNEGPLNSDFFIWYLMPLFAPAIASLRAGQPAPRSRRWSRRKKVEKDAKLPAHSLGPAK